MSAIYVPTPEERAHRQVARRRRQLIGDRVRLQNRIKAELRLNEVELPRESIGQWSAAFITHLQALRFRDSYLQKSFNSLLDQFDFVSQQIDAQTAQLKELAQSSTEVLK